MFTCVMQRVFLQDTFPAQLLVAAVAVGLQDVGVVAAPLVRPRGRLPGAGAWGGGSAGLAEDGRGGVPFVELKRRSTGRVVITEKVPTRASSWLKAPTY